VAAVGNCEHILMNFLVAHVTRRAPLKLTQRKQHRQSAPASPAGEGRTSVWADQVQFQQRQTCMEEFVSLFGYMPLLRSQARLDPLLFKDPVSNLRKKYKKIETVLN
jgi:glucuronyl/N-acetylglucosaminyl transferase EXT1